MLPPDKRELLLAALRPPEGYQFDRGIGTTFSLDLLTLLIAPLSLAFMDVTRTEETLHDPILLLEGLRRYADRLSIFCQAGRIAVPLAASYLYRFLEEMVVEVEAPGGGVFHPKVWLLRYLAEDEPPFYRFLCLSRNLTFDRSWDLMLRLEGKLAQRQRAFARNHPLGDFIGALPGLARRPVAQRIGEDVALLSDEVRRVAFQPPPPFDDELAFHPLGIPGYGGYNFHHDCSRLLVVSPFLSDQLLLRATKRGQEHRLVSRVDSINDLSPRGRGRFAKLYVLKDRVLEESEEQPTAEVGEEVPGARNEPSGLHAKLFVFDVGRRSHWLLGSANATDAAFRGNNVEFMVHLSGPKGLVGIDKVLGVEDDGLSLRALLSEYEAPTVGDGRDPEQKLAEELAGQARAWLIASGPKMNVVEKGEDRFDLAMRWHNPDQNPPGGDYTTTCWPLSLRPQQGIQLVLSSATGRLVFANLSLLSLTPFVAFEILAREGRVKHRIRFVLNLPISGLPDARDDHLLGAIISDRAQFLRYLRLVLAGDDSLSGALAGWGLLDAGGGSTSISLRDMAMPLLEELVRALSRSPEKIDRIERLVERLRRTEPGRAVLPNGFDSLWDNILQARRGTP